MKKFLVKLTLEQTIRLEKYADFISASQYSWPDDRYLLCMSHWKLQYLKVRREICRSDYYLRDYNCFTSLCSIKTIFFNVNPWILISRSLLEDSTEFYLTKHALKNVTLINTRIVPENKGLDIRYGHREHCIRPQPYDIPMFLVIIFRPAIPGLHNFLKYSYRIVVFILHTLNCIIIWPTHQTIMEKHYYYM